MVCLSLSPHLFILEKCPRVPTSPEMRVYRGGVSVPVSISIYPREESPCPHVPRNESVVVYVCFSDFTLLRLHVRRLIMFACRKVFTINEMSKINATINIT